MSIPARVLIGTVALCLVAIAYSSQVAVSAFTDGQGSVTLKSRECASDSQCNGRGTCVDGSCSCSFGYAGYNCEKTCRGAATNATGHITQVCSGHGTCLSRVGGRCKCDTGYWRTDCSYKLPVPTTPPSGQNATTTANSTVIEWEEPANADGRTGEYTGATYDVYSCETAAGCTALSQSVTDTPASVSALSRQRLSTSAEGTASQSTANLVLVCSNVAQTSCAVQNLKSGVRYTFFVYAKFRKSERSDPLQVQMNTDPVAPTYTTSKPIVDESITASSILARSVAPDILGGESDIAAVTSYTFQWRTQGSQSWNEDTVAVSTPGQSVTKQVSGLSQGTTLEFRLIAHNSAGASNASLISTATTTSASLVWTAAMTAGSISTGSNQANCNSWTSFRQSITTCSSITIRSPGYAGQTCSGSQAQTLCNTLRQASPSQVTVTCNGVQWSAGGSCGGERGNLVTGSSVCTCRTELNIRPCIGNSNWGTALPNDNSCSAQSHTMEVVVVP